MRDHRGELPSITNSASTNGVILETYLLPLSRVNDSLVDAEQVWYFSHHRGTDAKQLAPEVPSLMGDPVGWGMEAVVVARGQVHRHLHQSQVEEV